MPLPPDSLDPLLDRLRPPPDPSTRLTAEVWRRIAVVESETEPSGIFGRIEAVFSRPSFVVAFFAACMLFGLFLAEVRLSRLNAARGVQIAQSYLRLIDPLIDSPGTQIAANRP